jgi:hypothetical protein
LTVPHSYFGQQVAGSVLMILAHGQRTAGHALVLGAPVAVVAGTQVGQWYVGQQVIGSTPSLIGVAPSGQAIAIAGQATGLVGSQVDFAGTHCPVHVWPLQFPLASHMQDGSLVGQAQIGVGGTLVPVDGSGEVMFVPPVDVPPPVVVPPALQPQPEHVTSHTWPVGQSVLALQPVWMFGTQTP